MGYVITQWDQRYEVNKDNRSYKAGDTKRQRPLEYIRDKCSGHKQSAGYRYMIKLACDRGAEVFGVFSKLKEFAGMVDAESRDGTIYNEHAEAATIEDMAWMSGFSEESITFALTILSHERVGWTAEKKAEISADRETRRASAEIANPIGDNRDPLKDSDSESDEDKDEESESEQSRKSATVAFDNDLFGEGVDFESWADAKAKILEAFPRNKTVESTLNKIASKVLAGSVNQGRAVTDLKGICAEVAGPKISNPPGLFVAKCQKQFGVKRKSRKTTKESV